MKNLFILIALLSFNCMACTKEDKSESSDNYYIFGHFYGECNGEACIETFKLTDTQVFEDKEDLYSNGSNTHQGVFEVLSSTKFDLVKDLGQYFPPSLLTDDRTIIGQPDAGDWGGLYIEYNQDGINKSWTLDQMKSNVPEEYYTFIDTVNAKIALLQ